MRILFINPYLSINYGDYDSFGLFPPLGLAYIASVLETRGFTVRILDCQLGATRIKKQEPLRRVRIGMRDEEIVETIRAFSPDLVGISSNFTSFASDSLEVAKLVKNNFPRLPVVIGGAHATIAYEDILRSGYVDTVVRGEGEITFPELAQKLRNKESYWGLQSLAFIGQDGQIVATTARDPIANLDGLPLPAYHLLAMERYINQKDKNFAFYMDYPVGYMISSRGCPYNCIFCSTSKFFKTYRERSAGSVVDEIEFLIETYKVKEIHFFDDCFNANRKRVEAICDEILARGLKISWQVSQGMNIATMDCGLLGRMAKSGLYRIGFSIESGSEGTLKYIRKKIDLSQSLDIIRECNKRGIYTHGNFVIGFPFETKEDIQKTIQYVMRSNLDFIKFLICQPLAGADLYASYQEAGLLKGGLKEGSHYLHTVYDTRYLTADELNRLRKETVNKFLVRKILSTLTPGGFRLTIVPKITSLKKIWYLLRVTNAILKMMLLGKNIA